MYAYMYVCMYACMYVCMYIYCAACMSQVRSLACFIVTISFFIDRARNGIDYWKEYEKPVYFKLEIIY